MLLIYFKCFFILGNVLIFTNSDIPNYQQICDNNYSYCSRSKFKLSPFCCQENQPPTDVEHFSNAQICCDLPCHRSDKTCLSQLETDVSSNDIHNNPWLAGGVVIAIFLVKFVIYLFCVCNGECCHPVQDRILRNVLPPTNHSDYQPPSYESQVSLGQNHSRYGAPNKSVCHTITPTTIPNHFLIQGSSRTTVSHSTLNRESVSPPPQYEVISSGTDSSRGTLQGGQGSSSRHHTENGYSPFINQLLNDMNGTPNLPQPSGGQPSTEEMNGNVSPPPSYEEAIWTIGQQDS